MKRVKGRLTSIFSLLLILAGIVGISAAVGWGNELQPSGAEKEEHISFALYGDMKNQQIAEEVAAVFQKQNQCRVDIYCYSTEEELNTNIIGQIAGGNSFDVFIVSRELLSWLADEGEILLLDDIIEKRSREGEYFYEVGLSCGQVNGKQYALPAGVVPYMIYYNWTLLEEAGLKNPQILLQEAKWNLPGFAAYMREIQEKTGQPGLAFSADWYVEETFLRYNEGGWEEKDGQLYLDETARSNMELLQRLVQEEAIISGDKEIYDVLQKRFVEGELPMMVGGIDMTRICSQTDFSWDILPMPSAYNDFSNYSVEISLLTVGNGKHAELAKEFADFYVSALGQKLRLQQGECVMPSLNMVFYTSMGDVVFPEHSNYYFFAIDRGRAYGGKMVSAEQKKQLEEIWKNYMGDGA